MSRDIVPRYNDMDRADLAVEQWARERPDLRTLPMAVFGRLNEAAERVMREHMNPLFAKAGLQAGGFAVLPPLRPSPKARGGRLMVRPDPGKRLVDETLSRHVANEERLLLSLTQAEQETLD